ncbi:MAG: hypothetical protein ACKV2O_06230 [Acidimicrobiales bacterium]
MSAVPEADYLDAVARRIGHLPASEAAGLLEDVRGQLLETTSELSEVERADPRAFEALLGSAERFATEYLAAAGIVSEDDEAPARPGFFANLATVEPFAGWRRGARRTLSRPGVLAVSGFLPELRPAWWVLRGYLVVAVIPLLSDPRAAAASFPFPRVFGSALLGTLLVAVTIPLSVRVGRRGLIAGTKGEPRRAVKAMNALIGALTLLAVLGARPPHYQFQEAVVGANPVVFGGYLRQPDDKPITNILPYDLQGNALVDVLLYDQDGQPLRLADHEEFGLMDNTGRYLGREVQFDANGVPLDHLVPVQNFSCANPGPISPECYPLEPPRVVLPPLPRAPTSSPPTSAAVDPRTPSSTTAAGTLSIPPMTPTSPTPTSTTATSATPASTTPTSATPTSG